MKLKVFMVAVVVCCCVMTQAQRFAPPQNKNAALRYWAAFAEMKDRSVDDATSKYMEEVLSGTANWDEQRLGPIVEDNAYAVRAMQRATDLPECNWGLDYSLGAAMPLAHLPKARVLARLNALYGARQMAKGDVEGAVATWLAGLRFAQHVGEDTGLIGTLSAKPALTANLHLLTAAIQSGAVNSELKGKIRSQLRQLPADGLNYVDSIESEAWADEEGLKYLAKAPNFPETYKEFFNSPPPPLAKPPTQSDINSFRALMNQVVAAFQLPSTQTQERLAPVLEKLKDLNPAVQSVFPNYQRLNDTRKQVAAEKESLTKALN